MLSDMTYETLRYEPDGHVVVLTYDRPEQRNAISRQMNAELHEEGRDEALSFGEEVRTRVVEERVAVRVEVAAIGEYVHDPQHERGHNDDRKGGPEPARLTALVAGRLRHSEGGR